MIEQFTPAAPTITALFARAIDQRADRVACPLDPTSVPTLKIRRGPIVERYADEMARLYA